MGEVRYLNTAARHYVERQASKDPALQLLPEIARRDIRVCAEFDHLGVVMLEDVSQKRLDALGRIGTLNVLRGISEFYGFSPQEVQGAYNDDVADLARKFGDVRAL